MADSDHDEPLNIGQTANAVGRAMVAGEPPAPMGVARMNNDAGDTITLVAVVMGRANCDRVAKLLDGVRPTLDRVDIFD